MLQPWFKHARFGIFIHWGIYSHGRWAESWPFFNGEVDYDDYMAGAKEFTAAAYDPGKWAELFARAGAQYSVLTAKHHDGFALWPTAQSPLNAVEGAPAGRDLIGPYCEALRKQGLKVGIYFSHLDWSHPDYASVLPKGKQPHDHAKRHTNRFGYPQGKEDPAAWERFLKFHRAQLQELCQNYRPDLLWFDGDWERDSEQWRFKELRDQLHAWAPNVVLNSRMGGYGDYSTPEQAIPVTRPEGTWEFCVTINDSWGFQLKDDNFKSPRQCLWMLAECASLGGSLLLDIGPKVDGSIPEQSVAVLEAMGGWLRTNGEAIFGTEAGIPAGHVPALTTLSPDRRTLYLITFDRPQGPIPIKGIRNPVKRATVLGHPDPIECRQVGGAAWAGLPGVTWVDLPSERIDPLATAVKLEFEEPLDLYTGAGDTVTQNP
ncbi:MAG: alpha-L-fucosidase [Opitutaceae bacterium]